MSTNSQDFLRTEKKLVERYLVFIFLCVSEGNNFRMIGVPNFYARSGDLNVSESIRPS